MTDTIELLTPVGRLVQGSVFTPRTTDQLGNPLVYKTGAKQGQPRADYYIGLAIPKNDPGIPELMDKIQAAAKQGFPGGQWQNRDFAWKILDGDGLDDKNQPYSIRDGFAGCWIFKFSGGFAPKAYHAGNLLQDPESIKRGYYIRILGNTQGNNSSVSPGVYLNHAAVELIGYGEEIVSGPDHSAAFAAAGAAQLPPGASATPVAPAGGINGAPGGYQPPQGQPPAQGGYQPPQGQPPAQGGYQPPQGQPPAQGGYQPPQGQPPAQGGPAPHPGFGNPGQ